MRSNPYQTYLEEDILTADPVRLVQLLYKGALEAVAAARASLAERDMRARAGFISKAIEILAELSSSLNHEQGQDLSARLAALYDYMQRRLLDANQSQEDTPLAEVAQLLQGLSEAWMSVETPASMKPARTPGAEAAFQGGGAPGDVPLIAAY